MSDIIHPGAGVLFMKVGTHARESLVDIVARKTKEIEEAGYAMWGYGGNTCHPQTMVQPFARSFSEKGEVIHLCMHEMNSNHFAEQLRADEYSADSLEWHRIPDEINVMGSRFALVIGDLRKEELELPLTQTRVAIGRSQGKLGTRYILGRVDKACLEVVPNKELLNVDDGETVKINLVAELVPPYAVFLRNRD